MSGFRSFFSAVRSPATLAVLLAVAALVAAGCSGSKGGGGDDGGGGSDRSAGVFEQLGMETPFLFLAGPDAGYDVLMFDPKEKVVANLSRTSDLSEGAPSFAPDGKAIFWATGDGGRENAIMRLPADGSGEAVEVFSGPNQLSDPVLSPDGTTLLFTETIEATPGDLEKTNKDILALRMKDGAPQGAPRKLTDGPHIEANPAFSPDGKTIVFDGWVDGSIGLMMMEADGSLQRELFDTDGIDSGFRFLDGHSGVFESSASDGIHLMHFDMRGSKATPLLTTPGMHSSPVPIRLHKGRLGIAYSDGPIAGGAGEETYKLRVLSDFGLAADGTGTPKGTGKTDAVMAADTDVFINAGWQFSDNVSVSVTAATFLPGGLIDGPKAEGMTKHVDAAAMVASDVRVKFGG